MIEGARVRLRSAATEPLTYGDVRLAVEDRATGESLGTCGLAGADPVNRRATAYVEVAGEHAADALRALCRFAFDAMNLAKVEAEVPDGETAPYESVGFVREVRRERALWRDGGRHDEHLLGLLPAELA